jgi:hypothetical protein
LKQLFAALAILSLSIASQADTSQAPIHIAAISLLGDHLTVVRRAISVHSHLDPNEKQVLTLQDATFDDSALTLIDKQLQQRTPQPMISLLAISDADTYKQQDQLIEGDRYIGNALIDQQLKVENATQLILVTKRRGDVYLPGSAAHGEAKFEGLGFYVDANYRMRRSDTLETGFGYLAPYAYFNVSLIDLTTRKVIACKPVELTYPLSAARSKSSVDPWEALDADHKVSALKNLIEKGLKSNLPALLGS